MPPSHGVEMGVRYAAFLFFCIESKNVQVSIWLALIVRDVAVTPNPVETT
jgi:hypothetical protein